MPNPFLISTLTLITTLATTPTIANTNLNFILNRILEVRLYNQSIIKKDMIKG
jgi:hypothetical protein